MTEMRGRKRKIYLTRHCQSGGGDIAPFKFDSPISKLGVKQSRALGMRLKADGFNGVVFASPYYRTVATACHAAEVCGVTRVYPDARVQEKVSCIGGNMNGCATLEQLRGLFPKQIAADASLSHPWLLTEVEDYFTSQQARLEKALNEILAANPEEDILFVLHAGGVAAMNNILSKRAGMATRPDDMTWNCALFTYTIDENGVYRFDSYDISFMPEADVTFNFRATLLEKRAGKGQEVKSGVDYKQKP